MLASSFALKGTGEYENIQSILTGGAGASLLLMFASQRMKLK